jgi:LysM repeat protein
VSHVTRLHLPPDLTDDDIPLPVLGVAHAARLTVARPGIVLVIGPARRGAGWRSRVTAEWQPLLAEAFAPAVDGLGRLRIRPCQAIVRRLATDVVIDLTPQPGSWLTLGAIADLDARQWKELLPPAAAALLLASLSLPAAAATYEVRPGDTLSSISRTLYGRTADWRVLFQRNRHLVADPHQLRPGMVLQVPDRPAVAAAPAVPSQHQIVVRPGDTLFGLARRHLGDGAKWRLLWAALRNRVVSPSQLPVGLQISLPGERIAQKPTALVPPVAAAPPVAPMLPAGIPVPTETVPAVAASPEPAPEALVPMATASEAAATPVSQAPLPAAVTPALPEVAPPAPALTAHERPFASHVGLSFDPVTYHEAVAPQQLTSRGTILTAFGADASWRLGEWCEVSGLYQYNNYPLTRGQPTPDRRMEQHGRVTGYAVWPVTPGLELAAGIGGQLTGYGVQAGPPVERPEDIYDTGFQRLLAHGEAKVGWRPWPDRPLTVTASLQAIPIGQGFRLGADPIRLWGFGWSAGVRYSLQGLAIETVYRGTRLSGDGYGHSADQLQTGLAYYFQ